MADLSPLERDDLARQVRSMSDDGWKVEVLAQLKAINGTVRRHDEWLVGDTQSQTVGLLPWRRATDQRLDATDDLVLQARTTLRTVKWLIGVVASLNLGAFVVLLDRLSDLPAPQ